jgi:hypothetical protein
MTRWTDANRNRAGRGQVERITLDLYRELPRQKSANEQKMWPAGAGSIEPFQVSGWRGVRNALGMGFQYSCRAAGWEK